MNVAETSHAQGSAKTLIDLVPRRRNDVSVSRQVYKSGVYYVLYDAVRFSHYRLSQQDYQLYSRINGRCTLGEISLGLVRDGLVPEKNTQQLVNFIIRLNKKGLITFPVDVSDLLHRRALEQRESERRTKLAGFLFYRMPLVSPDRFLENTRRLIAPLFTKTALFLWFLATVFSVAIALRHIDELLNPFAHASVAESFVLMSLLLFVLKLIHEMGHAYACKHFGKNVPELGAYFIVFTPCAYINASSSWSLPKWQRIIVSLAGMYFETIAAMLALLIWCLVEPSLLKAAAHQAMLLATVVTIGFNINPLMKFDGYYVLADLLGRPTLRTDAIYEFQCVLKRWCYGIPSPSQEKGTMARAFLVLFGFAGTIYKTIVIAGILLMLTAIPVAGVPLATFFGLTTALQLGVKYVRFTFTSRESAQRRVRVITINALSIAAVVGITCTSAIPGSRKAYGVVHRQFSDTIHAEVDGFLTQTFVENGQDISQNTPICALTCHELETRKVSLDAEVTGSQVELGQSLQRRPSLVSIALERHRKLQAEQAEVARQVASLQVRSTSAGQVVDSSGVRVLGRFVRRGDPLVTVSHGDWKIRAMIDESILASGVPNQGDRLEVRLRSNPKLSLPGTVTFVAPSGSEEFVEALRQHPGDRVADLAAEKSAASAVAIEVLLDEADEEFLREGMVAIVDLTTSTPSIGRRLYCGWCRMWNSLFLIR